jgi:hypothetical protein
MIGAVHAPLGRRRNQRPDTRQRRPPVSLRTCGLPKPRMARDFTGEDAKNRILFINLKFFKYETDDKAHAGSIVLSMMLVSIAVLIMLIGLASSNTEWLEKVLGYVWSAFLFVSGVSIGRGQYSPPVD